MNTGGDGGGERGGTGGAFFQGFNVIFNKPIWGVFSSLKHRFHRTKGDEVTSRLRQLDVPDIFRQEKEGKISFYSRQNLVFPPKIEIRGLGCADLRSLPRLPGVSAMLSKCHPSVTTRAARAPRARRARRRPWRDASRSARRACPAHTASQRVFPRTFLKSALLNLE